MRRAVIAFSLAAVGAGCVADPDAPPLPQFGVRAQLQQGELPPVGSTLPEPARPTVWSDLPVARKLVGRRTVVATTEPVSVAEGELVWKPAGERHPPPPPPSSPPADEPKAEPPKPEPPKPEPPPATDESLTWGKAKRR